MKHLRAKCLICLLRKEEGGFGPLFMEKPFNPPFVKRLPNGSFAWGFTKRECKRHYLYLTTKEEDRTRAWCLNLAKIR